MAKYKMITLVEIQDNEGAIIPIGETINIIEWDGHTPYAPPENTELVLLD